MIWCPLEDLYFPCFFQFFLNQNWSLKSIVLDKLLKCSALKARHTAFSRCNISQILKLTLTLTSLTFYDPQKLWKLLFCKCNNYFHELIESNLNPTISLSFFTKVNLFILLIIHNTTWALTLLSHEITNYIRPKQCHVLLFRCVFNLINKFALVFY